MWVCIRGYVGWLIVWARGRSPCSIPIHAVRSCAPVCIIWARPVPKDSGKGKLPLSNMNCAGQGAAAMKVQMATKHLPPIRAAACPSVR